VVPFIVAALTRRRWRLGALLAGLCILAFPFGVVFLFFNPPTTYEPSAVSWLLGFYGVGVGLPEAVLFALLGAVFLRGARERAYGKVERLEAEENLKRARRLYEEGLGRADLSVIDELVSEDFRDLRHGGRGRLGMERVLQSLWETFPDLTVEVLGQEAEGDLVRTHLSLSDTDRGSGVLWFRPTGRSATFSAEFVDRFLGGKLAEHGGDTDTQGLLRQLGHPEENRPHG
jgi:predicted ester cyclase